MNFTEYRVIDEEGIGAFIKELNKAAEEGFKVISSNDLVLTGYTYYTNQISDGQSTVYYEPYVESTHYYALMVKNQFQESNNSHNFQYSVLDELKKIKLELREIVENLKYLGE